MIINMHGIVINLPSVSGVRRWGSVDVGPPSPPVRVGLPQTHTHTVTLQ